MDAPFPVCPGKGPPGHDAGQHHVACAEQDAEGHEQRGADKARQRRCPFEDDVDDCAEHAADFKNPAKRQAGYKQQQCGQDAQHPTTRKQHVHALNARVRDKSTGSRLDQRINACSKGLWWPTSWRWSWWRPLRA